MLNGDSAPPLIDAHVGGRIRAFRRRRGLTQERLAERLGLTFQQVQKYERGTNRVSASKLFEIATILGVGVSGFFAGLAEPADHEGGASLRDQGVAGLFDSLPPQHQQLIFALMQALSADS